MQPGETIAVIDFETTGLSPDNGARATEVAAVTIKDRKITGRYHNLMNAGVYVPDKITLLTGITNEMVRSAPSSKNVMHELLEFLGSSPLVAHNAAFDRRIMEHECRLLGTTFTNKFACSMLLSRRVFPGMKNYKLETLIHLLDIPTAGDFHRAESDVEMTAQLLLTIQDRITKEYGTKIISHNLLMQLQETNKSNVDSLLGSLVSDAEIIISPVVQKGSTKRTTKPARELDVLVRNGELSSYISGVLESNKIDDLLGLSKYTSEEIRILNGIGRKSFNTIAELLQNHKLHFADQKANTKAEKQINLKRKAKPATQGVGTMRQAKQADQNVDIIRQEKNPAPGHHVSDWYSEVMLIALLIFFILYLIIN